MSLWLFIGSIVLLLAVMLIWEFKNPSKAYKYLKENPGITKGIVVFIGIAMILGFLFLMISQKAHGDWFEYTEIYVGVDQTKKTSPMCEQFGQNDKTTSNGGVRQNIYTSDDDLFQFNLKYTHHSCAFNKDSSDYDAYGAEATYRLWWRK